MPCSKRQNSQNEIHGLLTQGPDGLCSTISEKPRHGGLVGEGEGAVQLIVGGDQRQLDVRIGTHL